MTEMLIYFYSQNTVPLLWKPHESNHNGGSVASSHIDSIHTLTNSTQTVWCCWQWEFESFGNRLQHTTTPQDTDNVEQLVFWHTFQEFQDFATSHDAAAKDITSILSGGLVFILNRVKLSLSLSWLYLWFQGLLHTPHIAYEAEYMYMTCVLKSKLFL